MNLASVLRPVARRPRRDTPLRHAPDSRYPVVVPVVSASRKTISTGLMWSSLLKDVCYTCYMYICMYAYIYIYIDSICYTYEVLDIVPVCNSSLELSKLSFNCVFCVCLSL